MTRLAENTRAEDKSAARGTRADQSQAFRVLVAGKLSAMECPGGGEVQMHATAAALGRLGVQVRMWRPWEDDLGWAHCLHLFGSAPEHIPVVEAAHRRGVPVVLSPIAWFDFAACLGEQRGLVHRVAAAAKFVLRAALPQLPSWRRRLYHAADVLAPNSQAEARQLVRFFRVPPDKLHVVPNAADTRFAAGRAELFEQAFAIRRFVLCPGRIEPRKNQLALIEALAGCELPVVILGHPVPGYQWYAAQCRRKAGRNVHFIQGMDHHDPLLASAYAAAACVVLCSWFETPGLAALEAALCGTPVVVPARGSAYEYFGPLAQYAKPNDQRSIRDAVLRAVARNRDPALAQHVSQRYTWQHAAQATLGAYAKAARNGASTNPR